MPDVILQEEHPFNIFVCADMDARIRRCMERASEGENLSPKELEQSIRRIDKNRAATREILTSSPWGRCGTYHLTVNTTDWNMKDLTPAVAAFITHWYKRRE